MPYELTLDDLKGDVEPRHISSFPYVDNSESEETEVTSDSDSDTNELDRNNNDKSPPPTQKFPPVGWPLGGQFRNSRNIDYPVETLNEYKARFKRMADYREAMPYSTTLFSGAENNRLTRRCDEIREMSSHRAPQHTANAVLNLYDRKHDMISDAFDEDRRSLQPPQPKCANANENNNSNNNKIANRLRAGSSPKSFDPQKSPHRRGRMRSVQLSSIRASKGFYEGMSIRPFRERMICKNGSSNVHLKKLSRIDWMSRYSRDIYTTLIDLSWAWIIFLTSAVYIGHWVIFGAIYWLFAIMNDDYAKIMGANAPSPIYEKEVNTSLAGSVFPLATQPESPVAVLNEEPCVSQVYDFMSAFLFSMESETTIGYGYRSMGTGCPVAVLCLVVQCVLSAIFDTWVIGMCFARLARPDARSKTILYPRHAVICTRDGKRCLLIRVANLRKSLLLGVSCRAHVITLRAPRGREEKEGHQFMLEQKELKFENAKTTMLTAPVEYRHVIDESSPLHSIPERCFMSERQHWFEIVVIVTGIVEGTGMTMHAQTSYLSTEIKYRHRFVPVLSMSPEKDRYVVDFGRFHDTVPEPSFVGLLAANKMEKESKKLLRSSFDERIGVLMEESEGESISDNVFPGGDTCDECDSGTSRRESCCSCRSCGEGEMENLLCHRQHDRQVTHSNNNNISDNGSVTSC